MLLLLGRVACPGPGPGPGHEYYHHHHAPGAWRRRWRWRRRRASGVGRGICIDNLGDGGGVGFGGFLGFWRTQGTPHSDRGFRALRIQNI